MDLNKHDKLSQPKKELDVLPDVAVLSPRVVRILGQNPGKYTLQGTNTYLVGSGKRRILIDAGEGNDVYTAVLGEYLRTTGIEIEYILVTHWHYDHTGGVTDVMDVLCSKQPKKPVAYKLLDDDEKGDEAILYTDVTDQQVFKVEGATITAFHTPGHTEDHLSFWLEEEKALFSGDSILGHGTTVFNHLKTYLESLYRVDNIEGLGRIYPGHGQLITDGKTKIREYIGHRLSRENQILAILKDSGPLSIRELTQIIYKGYPENLLDPAQRGIVLHLDKLQTERRAGLTSDGNWGLLDNPRL
jgi:glyoxylase-like metal-dependent hydrolase (beta-lactamase superfamily II)